MKHAFPASVWRPFAGAATLLAATSAFLLHAEGLDENPDYRAALAALKDELPAVAVTKLGALLASADTGETAAKDRVRLELLLTEALVRAGDFQKAAAAAASPAIATEPAARFWKAMAAARSGRYAEAERLLEPLGRLERFPLRNEAALNRASLLRALGEAEAALAEIAVINDSGAEMDIRSRANLLAAAIEIDRGNLDAARDWLRIDRVGSPIQQGMVERSLLEARLMLKQGDADAAVALFEDLAFGDDDATPPIVRHRARVDLAEALAEAGRREEAIDMLAGFIERAPSSPLMEAAFIRLDSLDALRRPAVRAEVEKWRADRGHVGRQALARFFSAVSLRRSGDRSAALAEFEAFTTDFPNHSLVPAAALEQAELFVQTLELDRAEAIVAQIRGQSRSPAVLNYLDGLEARMRFARGELVAAAAKFVEATGRPHESTDAFNAALGSLHAGDAENLARFAAELERAPETGLGAELTLERGLYFAAHDEAKAFQPLEQFVQAMGGQHPRAAEGELTLAELFLSQVPPQTAAAREMLDSARARELPLPDLERLDYTAIWTEVTAGDIAALIERAGRFLDEWPQSARRPSVLMVLGEAHFRGGDYPGAILVFQRLATESPGSPFAEPARFFAGKAASLTQSPENRALALEIWEEIARSGGALASAARHEQGLLKLARDDLDGAIETFDALLAMPAGALAVDRRLAVLCDLGQAWFMKASASPATPHAETGDASEPLRSAIAAFETVEKDPEASRAWRFQAAVRHGKCLELLGEKASALEVYYDVVRSGRPTAPLASIPVAEFDWYFRAGIAAVELLRSQENWRGAVRIAEQLARAGGSRAAEAARIAENLRLRHFLWDEPEG